jgi:hypothetical protein
MLGVVAMSVIRGWLGRPASLAARLFAFGRALGHLGMDKHGAAARGSHDSLCFFWLTAGFIKLA